VTAGDAPEKDPALQAWVDRHPAYTYMMTADGRHLVKTRDGFTVTCTRDAAEALVIARSWE
jgi:hypothetical protein